jgi:hypothetical protein
MRWCRSQKPAKSAASIFPVVAGCHPVRAWGNAKVAYEFMFWQGAPNRLANGEARAREISRAVNGVPGGDRPGFIKSRVSP